MSTTHPPSRIGSLWQQRMEGMREYEVVRDGNVFGSSFTNSIVHLSDYDKACHQLNELMARYHNIPFDEVFSGSEISNQEGVCFLHKSWTPLKITPMDCDKLRAEILKDLTLVHGIGVKTQERLKSKGYETLPDLIQHPKFRSSSDKTLKCLN